MTKKQAITVAKETIHAFGGVKATSVALGVPITTVSSWNRKGIPAWRLSAIRDAAQRLSVSLPQQVAA